MVHFFRWNIAHLGDYQTRWSSGCNYFINLKLLALPLLYSSALLRRDLLAPLIRDWHAVLGVFGQTFLLRDDPTFFLELHFASPLVLSFALINLYHL